MQKNAFIKLLYISVGLIATALGIIGIFVPLLPTTPFLLLAAWFFMRSSKKFHDKLLNHRILGLYVKNYIEHKCINQKIKIYSISLLWTGLIISSFFVSTTMIYILLATGVIVSFSLIFFLKTCE
ncbi:MAG: DUF454 domain-containing protein [Bacteroidales bacterium]|nr:DUF454 domain-containing protein [Bacteroidales bacterium]